MVMADDRSAAAIVVGGRPHMAAVSGLAGSVDAALVHRFHGSVLIVRGGDSAWNPASAAATSWPTRTWKKPARACAVGSAGFRSDRSWK
jgi:hypothetical protein